MFDCTDVRGHVYDSATGEFKFSLGDATPGKHIRHYDLQGIAVAPGPNGRYFVASGSSSPNVKIFDAAGNPQGHFKIEIDPLEAPLYQMTTLAMSTPMAATRSQKGVMFLSGMTVDNTGNLLIGVSNNAKSHFISKHAPCGKRIASIPTTYRAQYLTVTPNDTIVYTYPWGPRVAIMIDQTGKQLCILPPPTWVKKWRPTGICCSSDAIFVANDEQAASDEFGVYCYSLAGEYMGCATQEVVNPTGLVVTEHGKRLLVALYESGNPTQGQGLHGVKVFSRD